MRTMLFPDSRPDEIDDWFDCAEEGGTVHVGAVVFVADRGNGKLAGFVEVSVRDYAEGCETTPVAFLEGWYVDPDVRRQGVGKKLVDAAESWAKEQGLREIASDTEIENTISFKAHSALGYREVERQICFKKSL